MTDQRDEMMRRVAYQKSRARNLQRNLEALERDSTMRGFSDYLKLMVIESRAISYTLDLVYAKMQERSNTRIRNSQFKR